MPIFAESFADHRLFCEAKDIHSHVPPEGSVIEDPAAETFCICPTLLLVVGIGATPRVDKFAAVYAPNAMSAFRTDDNTKNLNNIGE